MYGVYRMHRKSFMLLLFIVAITTTNCFSPGQKYVYGKPFHKPVPLEEGEPQFETGRPNRFIDGLGHYFFSLPSKLLLWNRKMNNHNISEKTKNYLKKYIIENNLTDVKVRFNQYAPGAEWKRLRKNKNVHWLVRYTVGVFSWVMYTILPDRLFAGFLGGDHYNPYTNTINIFSDLPAVAIHEGAHAKDSNMRKNRTVYALVYGLPLVPLYHEARASEDAHKYIKKENDKKTEIDAHKQLSPAYGTYVGGEFSSWADPGTSMTIYLAGVIPGHIYGRYRARKLKKKYEQEEKENAQQKEKQLPFPQNEKPASEPAAP